MRNICHVSVMYNLTNSLRWMNGDVQNDKPFLTLFQTFTYLFSLLIDANNIIWFTTWEIMSKSLEWLLSYRTEHRVAFSQLYSQLWKVRQHAPVFFFVPRRNEVAEGGYWITKKHALWWLEFDQKRDSFQDQSGCDGKPSLVLLTSDG